MAAAPSSSPPAMRSPAWLVVALVPFLAAPLFISGNYHYGVAHQALIYVVLATGYELAPFLRPKGYQVISTWALATRPQKRALWPSRCLIWQAADPYLYLRTTQDGRVIAGGEDEEFADAATRDRLIPRKIAAVRRKLARLMPDLDTLPEFQWAGCFGASGSSMPAIGPVPGMPRCFAVLGYGGNGITFSVIAAQLVRAAILGIADPDAGLFSLDGP